MSEKSQYLIFRKYQREWLSEVTGFSKGYLSRVNMGKATLTDAFKVRCSFKLGESEDYLFGKPSNNSDIL